MSVAAPGKESLCNVGGNIFLVGLMGAGKTTVGRALAKRLNKRFIDSDHEIEERTGATIPLIFEIAVSYTHLTLPTIYSV